METKQQIRRFLAENLLFSDREFPLSDDASFLDAGVVDSTGVLELVLFVEETFGITVEDDEVTPENFDTVNNLVAFVAQRAA